MRPLEITLLIVGIAAVLFPIFSKNRGGAFGAAMAAVVVGFIHVIVEGPRWQLYGIYALVVFLAAVRALRTRSPQRHRASKFAVLGGGLVVLLTGLVASALPVPSIPSPDGQFAVGTTSWSVVDSDRVEVYDDSGQARRFVAQAWYPTETAGEPAPWINDAGAFSSAVAPTVSLPTFALTHLNLAESASLADVPIAPGAWPVVVYSHGWSGFRTVQSDYAEQLASQGFVVISLDHTYGAAVALFPNDVAGAGDAVEINLDALPDLDIVGEEAYQTAIELLEETFATDVAETLDQLAAGQGPDLLGTGLQLDRVGLSGHSTGGGAMVRLCLTDNRCAGVLGLDPWLEPVPTDLLARGMKSPLLSIRSEAWVSRPNDSLIKQFHADSPGSEGFFYIPGTTHADFTLQPFLTPLSDAIGTSGTADDQAVHAAVNAMAFDFFDRHLRFGQGIESRPALIAE